VLEADLKQPVSYLRYESTQTLPDQTTHWPALHAFSCEFVGAVTQLKAGLQQLAGDDSATKDYFRDRQLQDCREGTAYFSGLAGGMLGEAGLFLALTRVSRMIPRVGSIAPVFVGSALGLLKPLNEHQSQFARLINAAAGAATVGIIDHGADFLARRGLGGYLFTNDFTIYGMAGAVNTTCESYVQRGHLPNMSELATSAASWAATGSVFKVLHAQAKKSSVWHAEYCEFSSLGRQYARAEKQALKVTSGRVHVPTFTVPGMDTRPIPAVLSMDKAHPDAVFYDQHKPAIVRIRSVDGKAGSGFIVDKDGLIVTAHHVAKPSATPVKLKVDLADGRTFPARVLEENSYLDYAVLKIDTRGLPALKLGSSGSLTEKQPLFLFGHPDGASQTFLTKGVYSEVTFVNSGSGKALESPWVSTSVPAHFGNSGGPILSADGRVVAVVTHGAVPAHGMGPAMENIKPSIEALKLKANP
jgi:S1-C subfamily serine protease